MCRFRCAVVFANSVVLLALLLTSCATAPRTSVDFQADALRALAAGDAVAAVRAAEAADALDGAERERLWNRDYLANPRDSFAKNDQRRRDAMAVNEQRQRDSTWVLARAYHLAGRHVEAAEELLFTFRRGEPDALWMLMDVFDAMWIRAQSEGWLDGKREADGKWPDYLCQLPAAMAMLEAVKGNREKGIEALSAASATTNEPQALMAFHCVLGDLALRAGDAQSALFSYRSANACVAGTSDRGPRAVVALRMAQAQAALGEGDRATELLADLDAKLLLAPGQVETLMQLRSQAAEQVATAAQARGDQPTSPPELALLTTLDGLQGVTHAEGPNGSTIWSAGDLVRIQRASDGTLTAEFARGVYVPGYGASVQATDVDAPRLWRQRERCFDYGLALSGKDAVNGRFVLFGNGDLFVGSSTFAGNGVYLSPSRPPYSGTCCFGLPRERAWAVVEVLGSYTITGDEKWLRAKLADGSQFEGAAITTDGFLVPTRYACFTYPGRGAFIGWFNMGVPRDGGFFHLGDRLDLLDSGSWCVISENGGSTYVDYGEWNKTGGQALWWMDEFAWWPKSSFALWDRKTGIQLSIDNSLLFTAFVDQERLDRAQTQDESWERRRQERLQRELEQQASERRQAEELAEYRRTHPNWQEEEAARQQAEQAEVSTRAFQFMPAETSTLCIKCSGAGQLYVPGGATQGYRWNTTGAGSWQWGTTHTSGEMVQCHWCLGSGQR